MSAISFNNINTTNFGNSIKEQLLKTSIIGTRFEEVLKDLDDAEESAGDVTSLAMLGGTRVIDSQASDIGKVKSTGEVNGKNFSEKKGRY